VLDEAVFRRRGWRNWYAVVRLAPGVAIEQARAER